MVVLSIEERNVAANLKRLFEAQDLSLREFAKISGVHYRTFHRIMQGERAPRIGIVAKVAKALGVSVDELLKSPATKRTTKHVA